ncbi:TolB protein [Syntrophus gentianae]|uniref:TolB protein n=2 Tax=Syntrophus gentianae TaxID=43775 RepID=A0A1H7YLB5_9BACT|nr:TolB protein [Syntrophus gentianae]
MGCGKNRKRRRGIMMLSLFCVLALCGGAPALPSAWAKVYIDIDSPAFQKIPIAVADFAPLSGNSGQEELSSWFPGALNKSLDLTGYFTLLEKSRDSLNTKSSGSTAGGIDFTSWSKLGAEYLIAGGFAHQGGQLVAEFRLFDVVQGRQILGKQYSGGLEDRREMVLAFTREVLLLLTGAESFFDTRVAFVARQGNSSTLYTVGFKTSLGGQGPVRVMSSPALMLSPRWSPDGRYLSFASYRDGQPDVFVISPAGFGLKKIVGFKGLNLPGAWSPDGRRLLLTLSKDGNEEVYVMEVATGQLHRLTRNSAIDVSPVWSPDGRKIAFVSNSSGSPQIYVMNADGGGTRRLTYSGNYNTSPAWSPRGDRIAYEGRAGSGYQIFSVDEDGGNVRQLTSGAGDHESPSWSPDGRFLAFSARSGGRSRIQLVNVNTLEMRTIYESADRLLSPAWSPRGR